MFEASLATTTADDTPVGQPHLTDSCFANLNQPQRLRFTGVNDLPSQRRPARIRGNGSSAWFPWKSRNPTGLPSGWLPLTPLERPSAFYPSGKARRLGRWFPHHAKLLCQKSQRKSSAVTRATVVTTQTKTEQTIGKSVWQELAVIALHRSQRTGKAPSKSAIVGAQATTWATT